MKVTAYTAKLPELLTALITVSGRRTLFYLFRGENKKKRCKPQAT